MTYTFNIGDDVLIGRTVPGSARMRVHHETNRFIAAFDPDTDTLLDDQPKGVWVEVAAGVDPAFLKGIEPDVLNACRERFAWFQRQEKFKIIRCPRCEGTSCAKMLYGQSDVGDDDLKPRLDSGSYVRVGRAAEGGDPTRECLDCGYRWVETSDLADDEDSVGL